MNEIYEIVRQLNLIDEKWYTYITSSGDMISSNHQQLVSKFLELLAELKKLYKIDEKQCYKTLDAVVTKEIYRDALKKQLNQVLIYYNATSGLRILEKKNFDLCKELILKIIENYIVRLDKSFQNEYSKYEFENDDAFIKVVCTIDTLTEYYIRKTYISEDIASDFQDETGLGETLCQYYAELIEKHYHDIRANMILSNTERLLQRLERMEKK